MIFSAENPRLRKAAKRYHQSVKLIATRKQQIKMTLDSRKSVDIIETMENYISKHRPPVEIRPRLDLGYEITGQSVILFEIRPVWNNPSEIQHVPYAKATLVLKNNEWKIYWMRGNLKWYPYDPKPRVKKLSDFLKLVEEDKYACFKG